MTKTSFTQDVQSNEAADSGEIVDVKDTAS